MLVGTTEFSGPFSVCLQFARRFSRRLLIQDGCNRTAINLLYIEGREGKVLKRPLPSQLPSAEDWCVYYVSGERSVRRRKKTFGFASFLHVLGFSVFSPIVVMASAVTIKHCQRIQGREDPCWIDRKFLWLAGSVSRKVSIKSF